MADTLGIASGSVENFNQAERKCREVLSNPVSHNRGLVFDSRDAQVIENEAKQARIWIARKTYGGLSFK